MNFYDITRDVGGSSKISWKPVLDINNPLTFSAAYKILPSKGNLAWEYNPLRNLRLDLDMYEYGGKLHTKKEFLKDYPKYDENNLKAESTIPKTLPEGVLLYLKDELVDFITNQLSFDINHPINIVPNYSYDGSVDLIINDGKNIPRLINTRFSTTGLNTYEVVNRKGDNDSNIYDMGEQFDVDTSLYKRTNKIPKVTFEGATSGGDLKIGNYHFYFKYADADGNETDFVAESGLVSVFRGNYSPVSINTGNKNENSLKCVNFKLQNIDKGYPYLHIYYTKSTAEGNLNMVTNAYKIEQDFLIDDKGSSRVTINGTEEITEVSLVDINLQFNVALSSKSLAICQNMLFMANINKADIPYEELQDLSLRFLPYLHTKKYPLNMNEEYSINSSSKGYYDSKFIYNYTGYWNNDLYRLGIVYVMKDGTLSPVFNIRGREKVKEFIRYNHSENNVDSKAYTTIPLFKETENIAILTRNYVNYDPETNLIFLDSDSKSDALYENVKGVVSLDSSVDTDTILGFDIRTNEEVITELKKYVKGFFFVRLRRMPLTLCLGITIGIERNSKTPAIPTTHGITNIEYNNTYVETLDSDPNSIHYILEGFLSRYKFKLKPKSSGFWSKLGKIAAIAGAVAGAVAVSIVTAGAGGAVTLAALALSISTYSTALIVTGIAAGGSILTTAVVGGIQSAVLSSQLSKNRAKATSPKRGRYSTVELGYVREEVEDSRKLNTDFLDRIIILDPEDCDVSAMIVPDYTVHLEKYNQLFNGDEFTLEYATSLAQMEKGYFRNNGRHFYISLYLDYATPNKECVKLLGVPDGVSAVGIKNEIFRSKAGDETMAYRFLQARRTFRDDNINSNSDLIRGLFSPYVAMSGYNGDAALILNIKIPGYNEGKMLEYIQMRAADHSAYSAISDRFDISELKNPEVKLILDTPYYFQTECFRGDCYICLYTQRINRNFNDPEAPYNTTIVDPATWKQYDVNKAETINKINRGDVNAVELGMWITFRLRSNYNLNIRTLDESVLSEKTSSGHSRGYFPYHPMFTDGSYKIPDSLTYNLGFSKSLSERYNFEVPDVPYIRNWYGTRIMYSDINIEDGYKNGFRTFRGLNYLDYTREYGSITKIIEMSGNLIVVFEHGIGFLEVNEKAVIAQSLSGNAYINTNKVIPDKLTILSDAIGSQWADSIIKVPKALGTGDVRGGSLVFGVDTVSKKIWMCDGNSVWCISDFKVLEFLNNNITLKERDLVPYLGIRNVKTLYNAFKLDVMFTFYDCLNGFEDKAWNLCYNLTLGKFISFYSWIPSFMNNIDNIPFSFDRSVSKNIAQLGICKEGSDFSDGIILSSNIINNSLSNKYIGKLGLSNRILPFDDSNVTYKINYEVIRDSEENYKMFGVEEIQGDPWLVLLPNRDKAYSDVNKNKHLEKDEIIYTTKETLDNSIVEIGQIPENERYSADRLHSELYYRNLKGNSYSDWMENSNDPNYTDDSMAWDYLQKDENIEDYQKRMCNKLVNSVNKNLPVFKDRSGRKLMLPENSRINLDLIVRHINIRANIKVKFNDENKSLFDVYKDTYGQNNEVEEAQDGTTWINCGYYESTVAVTTEWNMQFLTSDFWKHGLAGIINIKDEIKPTVWYGRLHPFEFEFIVVNDPEMHKIFHNLEIVSNKAKPESFHFEVIGDSYDFAKDKPTMYFRLEARKALFLYNGCNISYNKDFLKILPKLSKKSAELVHSYYERQDKMLEILDNYVGISNINYDTWANLTPNKDYSHLSGAEIVYYPNRLEYRVWQHQPAIDIDDLPSDEAYSIIKGNCQYLEDRWRVSINPLLICYKNEYRKKTNDPLLSESNSTWANAMTSTHGKSNTKLPPITIWNTKLPKAIEKAGQIHFPNELKGEGKDNALYGLYYWKDQTNPNDTAESPVDNTNWLRSVDIYRTNFGGDLNRKETDIRDKFVKVRIRYSGEELAVIDFLNTIYSISYA